MPKISLISTAKARQLNSLQSRSLQSGVPVCIPGYPGRLLPPGMHTQSQIRSVHRWIRDITGYRETRQKDLGVSQMILL
eukprot:3560644-Rhodomonas_salina.1